MLPHLSEDEVYKFILFVGKIHHQNKFQPVLRDIEDGTMCVLRNVNMSYFRSFCRPPVYKQIGIVERWRKQIGPEYDEYNRYEGASRYVSRYGLICTSNKLKAQRKQCKYYTFNELAFHFKKIKRGFLGSKYVRKHIKKKIRVSGKEKCFDNYFHRK